MQTEGIKHPSASLKNPFFREVLNDLSVIVLISDMKGNILYANSQLEKQLGYAIEAGKKIKIWDLFEDNHRGEDFYIRCFERLLGDPFISFDSGLMNSDGKKGRLSITMRLMSKQAGQQMIVYTVRQLEAQDELEQQMLEVAEHERLRIGQDLHDSLGQMLSAISLVNRNLIQKYSRNGSILAEDLEDLSEMLYEADQISREIAHDLSFAAAALSDKSLGSVIRHICKRYRTIAGVQCEYSCKPGLKLSDQTMVLHLIRIVEEAIHNAVKHGAAKNIEIQLDYDAQYLKLHIDDNGMGLMQSGSPDETDGMGIRTMKHRAKVLGGTFELYQNKDGWTRAECVIPFTK